MISITAGTKPASAEEKEKAVDEVFKMLLMFRSANRIEGKIISNTLETRWAISKKPSKLKLSSLSKSRFSLRPKSN